MISIAAGVLVILTAALSMMTAPQLMARSEQLKETR